MEILDSERIIEFGRNLVPEAFNSFKKEMKLFGPRSNKALETDLRARLENKSQQQSVDEILSRLLEGLDNYRSVIYRNFDNFMKNPKGFNPKANIMAFWQLMNSFLLDLVERPPRIDSVILKEPVQNILCPFFDGIGYVVDFRISGWFGNRFPFFTVMLAKLHGREQVSEELFGMEMKYTLERLSTLEQSELFGILSFYRSTPPLIRLDGKTCKYDESNRNIWWERQVVETSTSQTYRDVILNHILLHEKAHYIYHHIIERFYPFDYSDHKSAFMHMVLSEVWARLITLYLFNGTVFFELQQLSNLKRAPDAVYKATFEFLYQNTDIFNIPGSKYEDVIYNTRIRAFDSILTAINWMRINLKHEPQNTWMPVVREIDATYKKGGIGPKDIADMYCPTIENKD